MKVIAKFAFSGNPSEGQLSFPEGAEIECNTDGHHPPRNGWMYGVYNYQKGWFPETFAAPPSNNDAPPTAPPPPPPPPPAQTGGSAAIPQPMMPPPPSAPPMAEAYAVPSASSSPYQQTTQQQHYIPPMPKPKELELSQIAKLLEQGFSKGLAMSLNKTAQSFAKRIWIVDNSGSMQKTDGHRLVATSRKHDVKFVACSRWEEIQECVAYHMELAALLRMPTSFRFLNDPGAHVGPQTITIDTTNDDNNNSQYVIQDALQTLNKARPGGVTPLTDHILAIHSEVESMLPQLRAHGQRVAIIIATDGLPTDEQGYGGDQHQQQFVKALRLLEGLPVWVVIRLCTDEEAVVNFYNDLDQLMELSIEVLDDFCGEAEEVHEHNPWLNYALVLHRMREMGYHERVFDLLDERPLTKSELRDFCSLLMGEQNIDGMPDPSLDWDGFIKHVDRWLKDKDEAPTQWNPLHKRIEPFVNVSKLHKKYGDSSCTIS